MRSAAATGQLESTQVEVSQQKKQNEVCNQDCAGSDRESNIKVKTNIFPDPAFTLSQVF